MSIAPHQQRVIDERRDLAVKLERLTAFREKPGFADLPLVDQGLLVQQADHMAAYLSVLDARIKRWGGA